MVKLDWEPLAETYPKGTAGPHGFTYRAKVPGGWLVATWAGTPANQGMGGGVAFVPDPNYGWEDETFRFKVPKGTIDNG